MARALLTKNSPFYIQFYVSKACNLRCKMCNIVEANADLKPFPTADIEKIADNLVAIGAGVILLTGGEPFLRPDIQDIVRIFKSRKLDVRLQTAGLNANRERIAKCVEYGARDINVSIDSLDEELSDYINGIKGSWRDALRTIAFISRTFPPKDSVCALGCVLSVYNVDEVEAVLDFATRIGWWLSLVPVHITTVAYPMNFRGYDEHFLFNASEFRKVDDLVDRLMKLKRQGARLFDSDDYLDSIRHFVRSGRPNWRHKGVCDSPNLYFAILPDGQFAPCCDHRLSEPVYVADPSFPEQYRSRSFRENVRRIAESCPGCNFGSFPEMTLTTRSPSTIRERILLQLRAKASGLKPLGEDEIFQIVEQVKKAHDVYRGDRHTRLREAKKWPEAANIPARLWNTRP